MRSPARPRLLLAALSLLFITCGGPGGVDDIERAELTEGKGAGPLVVGSTTWSQAAELLGKEIGEPEPTGGVAEFEASSLRLQFLVPEGGGEPVLYAIVALRRSNPDMPNHEGKTSRGIGFLSSTDEVHAAYGEPAAEWIRTFDRILYYTNGVIFTTEHPSKITGYDGAPPGPATLAVTAITITPPFEVLEASQAASGQGQLSVTGPPKTTLRISP
jgi:hypothetical protein